MEFNFLIVRSTLEGSSIEKDKSLELDGNSEIGSY